MGTGAPSNRAYGLYGASFIQYNFCQVNESAWMAVRGPRKAGARFSEREVPIFLKFSRPVIPIWELSLPQKKHKNLQERTFSKGSICELNKSVWIAGSGRKFPGAQFPEKEVLIFEFHWTIDSPMGTAALSNHSYSLYGTFNRQGKVSKVNQRVWLATRSCKNPGVQFSEKAVVIF